MKFTQHTAMKAIDQILAGAKPEDIDPTELSSLAAHFGQFRNETLDWICDTCDSIRKDRDYRNPDQMKIWDMAQALEDGAGMGDSF
jgi:hypothetical protein